MPVIQWFPGHMAKARRSLEENAPLVDVVLEVVDARCPLASRNADMMKPVAQKPHVLILNKADLADPVATARWVAYFKAQGILAVALDAVKGTGVREVLGAVREAFAPRLAEWVKKGRKPRPARAMVVGIPNVGKSSAINRLAGSRKAIVGDRPGVTRGKQWVRIGKDVELLDMPGILVPKFDDQYDGLLLAAIGCIKEEVFDQQFVVTELLPVLGAKSPAGLADRFGLTELAPDQGATMEQIGRHRGILLPGEAVDMPKVAYLVLRELREGKLGRITFQDPPQS